jgi:hypothetical protein
MRGKGILEMLSRHGKPSCFLHFGFPICNFKLLIFPALLSVFICVHPWFQKAKEPRHASRLLGLSCSENYGTSALTSAE